MVHRRPLHAARVLSAAAGLVDRAAALAMQAHGRYGRSRAGKMSHHERLSALAEIRRAYGGDGFLDESASFFPAPPSAALALRRVRPGVWEASWPSAFEPFLREVAERYLSRVENRTARARLYLKSPAEAESARPAVIAIHGYMGGQWLIEENVWPIEWLLRRGLDVGLPVLPFHAVRAGSRRGAPAFPSPDPRMTNEGFRQAVQDIRALVRWFRQRGAPHVGVMGMSLGGYTSALVATVTGEIDFVMPMIPLASIADFAREQGHLGGEDEVDEQHAALERAYAVVSPLSRPLRVPRARAVVVAAEHDRITPVGHADRISEHFNCSKVTISGAHLVQLGRSEAFRALASMLEREGIIPPRRARG